jgi:hypothetical protein
LAYFLKELPWHASLSEEIYIGTFITPQIGSLGDFIHFACNVQNNCYDKKINGVALIFALTSSTMNALRFHSKSSSSMSLGIFNPSWTYMLLFQVELIQAMRIPFYHSSKTINVCNENCERTKKKKSKCPIMIYHA